MAQSKARVAEPLSQSLHDDQCSSRSLPGAEILQPIEQLHRRFDDAYDRVEELGALIHARRSRGFECSTLIEMLKEAEVKKKEALVALRKARWLKIVSAD